MVDGETVDGEFRFLNSAVDGGQCGGLCSGCWVADGG